MKTDIEIAQSSKMKKIVDIAKKLNIDKNNIELYGDYKAKIKVENIKENKNGKLILVTAMSPTKAGEGKTTTSIGLADALNKINKNTMLCLREPSLGPSFGMKGGACGGGYAQVLPMEDINLHFTGDIHAVTTAHNLLSAMIDNSIFQGNLLNIDPNKVTWKRVVDLNDRALREIEIGLGEKNGTPRKTGFDITVASEIMAILCLSKDLMDLKEKIKKIIIGYTYDDIPVNVKDLKAEEAMTLIMKDAIKPNLVQTIEHTPTLIHGGPFANIAHGCNSIIATSNALKLSDYVVTEAGFGSDLGGEKFFDLKCRIGNLKPSVAVVVSTVRALKMHGGVLKEDLYKVNLEAIKNGIPNLERHIENIKKYNVPIVIALNKFDTDSKKELDFVVNYFKDKNINIAISEVFSKGSKGGIDLAIKVIDSIKDNKFKPIYNLDLSIEDKIKVIAKEIYRANNVIFEKEALNMLDKINKLGYNNLPICIAKTQYSFSDDEKLIGAPTNFDITIREIRLSIGAGFIVCIAGKIMTMPGLPKEPMACKMKINTIDGKNIIEGLF
ncbi:MAG: formate--tetrahydrofolate ligase [Bacilli bacterium]|nr:formate--tetrahydrofolate ligase [Bacilli bacterium]MDD3995472.1 formate--tetrahydrofolate ligase [Bacilli bacterium]